MKRILVIASLSMSLAAGAAIAQDVPPPPPAPPAANADMAPPPPPPGEAAPGDAMMKGEARMKGDMMKGDRWDRGPRGPDGHLPPPPPPSKAAHYRVETRDVKIDLKCADDEPAKACSDLLMSTIDKLGVTRN